MSSLDLELKKANKQRLKLYLRSYWVKPLQDKNLKLLAQKLVAEDLNSLAVQGRPELMKAFAQQVILAFKESIFWESFEAYSLVEDYIQGDTVVNNHLEPKLVIIEFGVNQTPNKMLLPLVNGLVATRAAHKKKTLILCYRNDSELEPQPVTISSSTHKEVL